MKKLPITILLLSIFTTPLIGITTTSQIASANHAKTTELEETLKKAPHSERSSLLMAIADEKLENLKQISNNILQLRKTSYEALIGENKRKKRAEDEALRDRFENIFKKFDDLRSEVSICASCDVERSFYGFSLFAQAYYDFTELFVQFVKEDLFPRDWRYLNFDELKPK